MFNNVTLPPIRPARRFTVTRDDVFILAEGFEDRSLAALDLLDASNAGTCVVLNYLPKDRRNRTSDLSQLLRAKGFTSGRLEALTFRRFGPDAFGAQLESSLMARRAKRAFIDVSAMSKLAILLILETCRRLYLDVTVLYTEAIEYGPNEEAYQRARQENDLHQPSLQIYTGIHDVIRIKELSSVAMQGQPVAALAFMSFNESLTQTLVNSVYPTRLFLINGRPPVLTWREAATAWIHERLRREWPERDNPVDSDGLPVRVASTLDYRESLSVLFGLYADLTFNHRVLLAPTGSKMQTIGCYLFRAAHPDVQIEYPTPHGFLDLYSTGTGHIWNLPLGPLQTLVEDIGRTQRRQLLASGAYV